MQLPSLDSTKYNGFAGDNYAIDAKRGHNSYCIFWKI